MPFRPAAAIGHKRRVTSSICTSLCIPAVDDGRQARLDGVRLGFLFWPVLARVGASRCHHVHGNRTEKRGVGQRNARRSTRRLGLRAPPRVPRERFALVNRTLYCGGRRLRRVLSRKNRPNSLSPSTPSPSTEANNVHLRTALPLRAASVRKMGRVSDSRAPTANPQPQINRPASRSPPAGLATAALRPSVSSSTLR